MALRRADDDPLQFRDVFEQHAPMVWRTLRFLGVRPADLDDACQDVFVVVARRLGEFDPDGPGRLETWLFAIARNVARAHRRRAFHRYEVGRSEPPEVEVSAPQQRTLEGREAIRTLSAALERLDPKLRDVFVLHDVEGLPMREVVAATGCPLATGYSRLRTARARLDALLEDGEDQ